MNPLVKEYLAKKFDLGDYTDENRQELANQDLSTQDRIGASLTALGAGIQGQNAGAAGGAVLDRLQKQKQSELETFDKGRASKIQDYGLDRQVTEDMANDSFDSPEAETYRGIAKKFAPSLDTSKMSVKQIKELLPSSQALADMELKKRELAAKQGKLTGGTEGFKALDKDYAKDYNDFTGGGETKAQDAIKKLKDWQTKLGSESKEWFGAGGGSMVGSLPDAFRDEESIAIRDNVISAANSALKATFGGQLSDGERAALANEFYNDKLSPKANIEIMTRKISELEGGLKDQRAKADYFQNSGSLRGFQRQSQPATAQTPGWDDNKAKRLQELRAKKASGGLG